MTRSSAALLFALAAPAAAEPCPPHAQLDGDPAAVANVTVELVKLGMTVSGEPSSCKTVVASVEVGREGGLAVAVEHGTQSEGREVNDAVVAASWINSWAVDDFEPSRALDVASLPPGMAAPGMAAPDARHGEPESTASTSTLDHFAVSAALDQAWTFDGARWTGISAGACARIGGFCVGARGRYGTESELVGQTAARRTDLSLLATASYPTHLGRVELVPEFGLGVGQMTTSRLDGCRRVAACNPQDQGCVQPPQDDDCIHRDPEHAFALALDDHFSQTSVTPRISASMRLAVPLGNHVWLDTLAAVMLSPFNHSAAYEFSMTEAPPFGVPRDQLALPGEPVGTFSVGIGLRVGTL